MLAIKMVRNIIYNHILSRNYFFFKESRDVSITNIFIDMLIVLNGNLKSLLDLIVLLWTMRLIFDKKKWIIIPKSFFLEEVNIQDIRL